ncbi:MAG: hypothetical protein RIQ81_1677 [Pseudomonadota bacterium]|jgi:glycosyltransferase involved in cell wall biosynthesis
MSEVDVSIVMPCLNEARTLADCISKATNYLQFSGCRGEIIVADNGSSDDSAIIAQSNGARVVSVAARGYGAACLGGIKAAQGRYVILGDSDGSYDFLRLEGFHQKLEEGFEVVIGNRFKGGIKPNAMPWKNRLLGNPVLSLLGRILAGNQIGDFHCGLRGFHREKIVNLGLRSTGMEFASELIVRAAGAGLRITEVPTVLYPDGRGRRPHLRPWRDGWRHLCLLCILAPKRLLAIPGIILFFAGAIGLAGTVTRTMHIGDAVLDIGGMLCFGLILNIGFQLLISGFLLDEILRVNEARGQLMSQYLSINRIAPFGFGLFSGSVLGIAIALEKWREAGFAGMPSTDHARLIGFSLIIGILSIQLFTTGLAVDALRYSRTQPGK